MEDAFVERARPTLQLAYMLLLYTVQRPSDVLSMDASLISERNGRLFIALRQSKTGTLLDVPIHERLASRIRERMRQIEQETPGRTGRRDARTGSPAPGCWCQARRAGPGPDAISAVRGTRSCDRWRSARRSSCSKRA